MEDEGELSAIRMTLQSISCELRRLSKWAAIYRLEPFFNRRTNKWHVVASIPETLSNSESAFEVASSGSTPEEAIENFDKAMQSKEGRA